MGTQLCSYSRHNHGQSIHRWTQLCSGQTLRTDIHHSYVFTCFGFYVIGKVKPTPSLHAIYNHEVSGVGLKGCHFASHCPSPCPELSTVPGLKSSVHNRCPLTSRDTLGIIQEMTWDICFDYFCVYSSFYEPSLSLDLNSLHGKQSSEADN